MNWTDVDYEALVELREEMRKSDATNPRHLAALEAVIEVAAGCWYGPVSLEAKGTTTIQFTGFRDGDLISLGGESEQ